MARGVGKMNMRDRIMSAMKMAMKDKDKLRVSTLRLVNAAIKEREIALRSNEDAGEIDASEILQILSKMVKQREESAKAYEDAGREDLSTRERSEIKVIREFLPKPLSDEEVVKAVENAVKETGASSIKDMGKVMGLLRSDLAGKADMGSVSQKIKALLQS